MGQALECDKEIFEKGGPIIILDGRTDDVQRFVEWISKTADAKADWSYMGGRAVVRTLPENRKKFLAVLSGVEDETIASFIAKNNAPPFEDYTGVLKRYYDEDAFVDGERVGDFSGTSLLEKFTFYLCVSQTSNDRSKAREWGKKAEICRQEIERRLLA